MSGTGDGGGENEGYIEGVHRHMEEVQPSYVRRRCLNHLAWTVAKAGLKEVEALSDAATGICTYLSQGITWFSLKALAVQPIVEGGLGLLREGSREYQAIFAKMPGTIDTDRPESVMRFQDFLRGREQTLGRCAARDVQDRHLGAAAKSAAASLQDIHARVKRSILAELMYRNLHLARVGNVVQRVALESTLEETLHVENLL